MPRGPKGEKHPADVIGNAVHGDMANDAALIHGVVVICRGRFGSHTAVT
jgi:hypothetical protein